MFTAMHPRENRDPELAVAFGRPIRAGTIEIRVRDPGLLEPAHVHIREIKFLD